MTQGTKTEAAIEMRQRGLSTLDIAEALAISTNNVRSLFYAGKRGKRARRAAEASTRTVLFPVEILVALGPAASKRGIHPNALARRIVETVVDEKMVDAVLDDGESA